MIWKTIFLQSVSNPPAQFAGTFIVTTDITVVLSLVIREHCLNRTGIMSNGINLSTIKEPLIYRTKPVHQVYTCLCYYDFFLTCRAHIYCIHIQGFESGEHYTL